LQTNFALPYLQKRVENTPPMVWQIRFAIWLTLQIEVEALHICKHFHHFASTISVFHVGLRPPAPPPRAISLRPSALLAARARLPPAAARGRRPRTDANDDGDERRTRPGLGDDWREDLGWAATGTHDVRQNGVKGKKRAGAIGEKKIRG